MLRSIGMRNYRAFRSAKYPIKPVTIFLGSNSVGKTSALQLPLLLKQTASVSGNDYSSALKVHGRDVSFGLPSNLFHNQNTSENLVIDININDSDFYNFLTKGVSSGIRGAILNIAQYLLFSSSNRKELPDLDDRLVRRLMRQTEKDKAFSQDYQQLIEDLLSLKVSLTEKSDIDLAKVPFFRNSTYLIQERYGSTRLNRGTLNFKTLSRSDLERTFRYLNGVNEIANRGFEFSFGLGLTGPENNRSLRIEKFSISTNSAKLKNLLTLQFNNDGDVSDCSSDYLPSSDTNAYNKVLSDNFVTGHDIFSFVRPYTDNIRYLFPEIVRQISHMAVGILHSSFADGAIRHIGPLRAYPKRFYFLDTAQAGSADGDSLVEALRENSNLKKQVNEWLGRFGVNLNVNQFQEIIHRLAIKSGKNSFELDITDVGFGISQILPILVEGYLSPPGTTILVEQPEIHLHPKMQGDLADLFISMSGARSPTKMDTKTNNQRFFLVETHSEYLLNRLRRRIAERAVSHEDIAIVIADRISDGSTTLESVPVSENGSFRWPAGFQEATLDDAIAYAQAVAASGKQL